MDGKDAYTCQRKGGRKLVTAYIKEASETSLTKMLRILRLLSLSLTCIPTAQADQWVQIDEGVWAKKDITFKRTKGYRRIYIRLEGFDDSKALFDCQKKRQKSFTRNARKIWVINGGWEDVTSDTNGWTLLRFACYNE